MVLEKAVRAPSRSRVRFTRLLELPEGTFTYVWSYLGRAIGAECNHVDVTFVPFKDCRSDQHGDDGDHWRAVGGAAVGLD
jgi:hypothetical protein